MSELESVVERLERLEQQNRRLKGAGIAGLLLCAGVLLMGQVSAPEAPQRLSVRSLAVVNESGALVAQIDENGLSLLDERGIAAATIVGSALTLINEANQQARLDPGALRVGEGDQPLVYLGRNYTGGPGSTLVLRDGGPGSTATLSATIGADLTLQSRPTGCRAEMGPAWSQISPLPATTANLQSAWLHRTQAPCSDWTAPGLRWFGSRNKSRPTAVVP